jgi:hypothetical protein
MMQCGLRSRCVPLLGGAHATRLGTASSRWLGATSSTPRGAEKSATLSYISWRCTQQPQCALWLGRVLSRCRAAGRCPHDTNAFDNSELFTPSNRTPPQLSSHTRHCFGVPVPADKSLEQLRNYQSRPLGSGHREPDARHLEIGVDSCGRMFLSPWMPGCLPVGLHTCLRVCMSAFLCGCLPAGWLVCERVCMSACQYVCQSACLSACPSACF